MARTALTKTALVGPFFDTIAANGLDVTFTAADTVNQNSIAFGATGRVLIVARNTSTTTAFTLTITSFPSASVGLRSKDVTAYSLGAGEMAQYVVQRTGWEQADGLIYVEANNVAIEFAAFDI